MLFFIEIFHGDFGDEIFDINYQEISTFNFYNIPFFEIFYLWEFLGYVVSMRLKLLGGVFFIWSFIFIRIIYLVQALSEC